MFPQQTNISPQLAHKYEAQRANVSVHGTNNVLLRFIFNSRQKNENETVDQYVTALRTLVIEISENTTQKKLLQDRKLTLSRAIDICRSSETTSP